MPALDRYGSVPSGLDAPSDDGVAITPAVAELAVVTRALWVGGLGDVAVVMRSGAQLTFSAVPAGTLLPVRVRAVLPATTATLIVGLL